MALRLTANVVVNARAARLFEMISTPEMLPRWNVSVDAARRVDPMAPVCLGARAVMSGKLLGQTLESETEVVAFEPPRLFATCAIRGPKLNTRFELESLGEATRVFVDVSGEVPGGALGSMLVEGFLRRELTASLERLRAIGEASET